MNSCSFAILRFVRGAKLVLVGETVEPLATARFCPVAPTTAVILPSAKVFPDSWAVLEVSFLAGSPE